MVENEEGYEVEVIIAHRLVGPHKPEYLVRFKGYATVLEDDLKEIWKMLWKSSEPTRPDKLTTSLYRPNLTKPSKPPSTLRCMGHVFYYVSTTHLAAIVTEDCVQV